MAARGLKVKTLAQYIVFGVIVILAYRLYTGGSPAQAPRGDESKYDDDIDHPRNVRPPNVGESFEEMDRKWAGVKDEERDRQGQMRQEAEEDEGVAQLQDGIKNSVDEVKNEDSEGQQNAQNDPKINVGDMPKNLAPEAYDDLLDRKGQKALMNEIKKKEALKGYRTGKDRQMFLADGIDWALEEELKKRRSFFYERLEQKAEEVKADEFKDMHERDENFPFVTAGSHTTYPATLEFIYSIQYFYPHSEIAIYDIGFTSDEREFLRSLCGTVVESLWLNLWPEDMYRIRHRVWRPTVLQFAMAKYGHFVFVQPGKFIYKQRIKDYIKHSRLHGLTVAGNQFKYSTFSVTNPHMYTFLMIDERKLQKIPHFDFSLMVLHNTNRVRHYFMRFLISCIMEEYCISPPGSRYNCDRTLDNSKRYANCHRYDESAINLILNKWHNYRSEEFLMHDAITKHFDGKDVTKKLRVCNKTIREEV